MSNHANLKEELKLLYCEEQIGEAQLNQMSDNLIRFFAIGVDIINPAEDDCDENLEKEEKNNDLFICQK